VSRDLLSPAEVRQIRLNDTRDLRDSARAIFDDALRAVDARRAVLEAVRVEGRSLQVFGERFDPRERHAKIYSVALGKAAAAMASALEERLGDSLAGVGGRNSETALRCAFEIEKALRGRNEGASPRRVVALCAGTDGVDGNSLAAGAIACDSTLHRADARGLDASKSLEESDACTFFESLGDAIHTGPTGTNVRDLRILLAE
jgi:glycerate-2-kinase